MSLVITHPAPSCLTHTHILTSLFGKEGKKEKKKEKKKRRAVSDKRKDEAKKERQEGVWMYIVSLKFKRCYSSCGMGMGVGNTKAVVCVCVLKSMAAGRHERLEGTRVPVFHSGCCSFWGRT